MIAPPTDAGSTQSGQASWASSAIGSPVADSAAAAAPADAAASGADATSAPSLPAQRKRNTTVAAYFLITTSPDQMSAVARNVSMPQTANKFDQQLRLAGTIPSSCAISMQATVIMEPLMPD